MRNTERARSISPSKDSAPYDLSLAGQLSSVSSHSIRPPIELAPSTTTRRPETEAGQGPYNSRDIRSLTFGDQADSIMPMGLGSQQERASWKQQPASIDYDTKTSTPPRQMKNFPVVDTPISSTESDPTVSRAEVTQPVGFKEPSWSQQTSDKGVWSPSFRRTRGPSDADTVSRSGSGTFKLPGVSRESTAEPEKPLFYEYDSERSRTPSRASSTYPPTSMGNRYSSFSSVSAAGALGSPVPLGHRRVDSQTSRHDVDTDSMVTGHGPMSPSQGRLIDDRISSPTKGLGGFVQSAMMKRSDSVSKRWSAQTGRAPHKLSSYPQISSPNDNSNSVVSSSSRPGSSHSDATVIRTPAEAEEAGKFSTAKDRVEATRHGKMSISSLTSLKPDSSNAVNDKDLPVSSTKTMESKRWSPTKASWLESALNRPESPTKPKVNVETVPAWRRDLERMRRNRASVDLKDPAKPPPATLSINEVSKGDSSYSGDKKPETRPGSNLRGIFPPSIPEKKENLHSNVEVASFGAKSQEDELVKPTPLSGRRLDSPSLATKPTPPVHDFRANLRRRETVTESAKSEEPEFKNVFGKLRKAHTQNYVAPDPFKDNILRGKASLNATSGSQKPERVDGFKENIMKPKDTMASGIELHRAKNRREVTTPKAASDVPEAIAKRSALTSKASTQATAPTAPEKPRVLSSGFKNSNSLNLPKSNALETPPVSQQTSSPNPVSESPKLNQEPSPSSFLPPHDVLKQGSSEQRPVPGKSFITGPINQPSTEAGKGGKLAGRINPALAGLLSRGPPTASNESSKSVLGKSSPDADSSPYQSPSERTSSPATLTHMTKSRARGPKRRLPKSTAPNVHTSDKKEITPNPDLSNESEESFANDVLNKRPAGDTSPELPPKRIVSPFLGQQVLPREPPVTDDKPSLSGLKSSSPLPQQQSSSVAQNMEMLEPIEKSANSSETPPLVDNPLKPAPLAPRSSNNSIKEPPPSNSDSDKVKAASKPLVSPKSAELRKISQEWASKNESSVSIKDKVSSEENPSEQISVRPRSNENELVVKKRISIPARSPTMDNSEMSTPRPLQKSRTWGLKEPIDTQKRPLVVADIPPADEIAPRKPSTSVGIPNRQEATSPLQKARTWDPKVVEPEKKPVQGSSATTKNVFPKPMSVPPRSLPPTPTNTSPVKTPGSSPTRKVYVHPDKPPASSPPKASFPEGGVAVTLFSSFFDKPPSASEKVSVDPLPLFEGRYPAPAMKTVSKQIWQLSGDGRKKNLPSNQEYVLFEEDMYLCVHVFEKGNGVTTQVYLWCGDGVSEPQVDDVQLFARKVARESGSKLDILKQGKESTGFVQALGGIIVTRRGSSSRSNPSEPYMLCGRRYMGQVVFDEVDLSYTKLHPGYPHIISVPPRKLFLWQGIGSTAEELGCARLIGMDLGLTEIEEVQEGHEPPDFFRHLSHAEKPNPLMGADYWKLKPFHPKYCTRLFKVDHNLSSRFGSSFWIRRGASSPSKLSNVIQEIEPFYSRDLEPENIYVLDTFFRIFV